ncbi:MAG: hypothetical protein ABI779_09315 [Acidobacteriota bacterium]
MHRFVSLLILLTLTLGCATTNSTRPTTIAKPEIEAFLVQSLHFGGGSVAPATIEVRITNRAKVPIVARRISIDSPGMQEYTISRGSREIREVINPGETKRVNIFAEATALTGITNVTEPLSLRAVIDFESGKTVWREVELMMR